MNSGGWIRRLFLLILCGTLIFGLIFSFGSPRSGKVWSYNQLTSAITQHQVEEVVISPTSNKARVKLVNQAPVDVTLPPENPILTSLADQGVAVKIEEAGDGAGFLGAIFSFLFPFLLFFGFLLILRSGPGGGSSFMKFGESKAKTQTSPTSSKITFMDVAGVEEAKQELQEVVDFLGNGDRFTSLGAKIPKGVLLVGPPGTGKTLLAKAVAGEANVPFFSMSGSEFVEMFVGVGASRVRDLFKKAKKSAPCIIFIDEIDAVGRQRGISIGGGNDEREQTLNQLLTEMDGFDANNGVVIIAATNRPDVLDAALLRPGRFDRQVVVDRPDLEGRVAILKVHMRGKALAKDLDARAVAKRVPGFTGADLANVMNEAAILAARRKLTEIGMAEINDSIDRVLAGAEKPGIFSEKRKELLAFHEGGHALVGALMTDYDLVQKVSIIPRGRAAGLTWFVPNEERTDSGLYNYKYLIDQMTVALGGRAAEELKYGAEGITTGAANDLQQVTRIARDLITKYGMSSLGLAAWGSSEGMFLGREMGGEREISSYTAMRIDREINNIIASCYNRAKQLLSSNMEVLQRVVSVLVEKETLEAEEFRRILCDCNIPHGGTGGGCISPHDCPDYKGFEP